MHNKFINKIELISKEIKAIDAQLDLLSKNPSKDEFITVTAKQSKLKEELKKLYVEINSWEKSIDNPQKAVTKVLSQKLDVMPHHVQDPDQEIIKKIALKPITKPVIEQKQAIPDVKEASPVQSKEPINGTVLTQKKPVKKDDFHSKVTQEAENQAKYIASISKSSRNYGNA